MHFLSKDSLISSPLLSPGNGKTESRLIIELDYVPDLDVIQFGYCNSSAYGDWTYFLIHRDIAVVSLGSGLTARVTNLSYDERNWPSDAKGRQWKDHVVIRYRDEDKALQKRKELLNVLANK